MTQFIMSGVNTNVTVKVLGDNQFSFALHLSDTFEGGELIPAKDETDGIVIRNHGLWKLRSGSKVFLSQEDVNSLGAAIEDDYLSD